VSGNQVRTETRGDTTVMHVDGRLVLGEGDSALTTAVHALLKSQKAPKTVLDLSNTQYMDSAGIGALVTAYTSVTSAGGVLALAGPSKRIMDLLKITRLDSVFPTYASVDEAIAGLQSAGQANA
jgi:anti-sigma B factor antagonist